MAVQASSRGALTERDVLVELETQGSLRNGAYKDWMARVFDKALKQARRLKGFKRAFIASRLDCSYLRHCKGLDLKKDEMLIPGLDTSIAHYLPGPLANDTYAQYAQDLDEVGIARAQVSKVGRQKYLVLTLGRGMFRAPCGDRDGDMDDCGQEKATQETCSCHAKRQPPAFAAASSRE